jgi:two-component system NtrC family sensor kinase
MYPLRLTLRQRLAFSYGAVIVLLIAVSFLGLGVLADLSRITDDALKDKYPKTILVNQIINDLESSARAMRNTLFLKDDPQLQQQLIEIQTAKTRMVEALANLKKYAAAVGADAQVTDIVREIEIVNSAYVVNQDDFVNMVSEKRMNEAKNLLLVDLHPYQIQYFDLLHKLNRHQSVLMSDASDEIFQASNYARKLIIALTVVAVLLSIFITVFIARSLLAQLGGEPDYAATIAKRITAGDLSSDIYIDSGDQSSLLFVMRAMRDRLLERTDSLESANLELEAMVDTLKRTQDDLVSSEKMAALGYLVAGIAHELNTPIGNGVMTASTLADMTNAMSESLKNNSVRRSALDHFFTEMQQGEEILLRNLNRASELVSSFKQVAVDRETSQFRKFMLSDVVNEILLTLQPTIKTTPFKLVCEVAPGISMETYPGPLGQVLTNLINNALIHGFDRRENGTIVVSVQNETAQTLELLVADDGVGIPPENLPHIYEPFFTTRLGFGGSGLGLHIVHNVVHALLHGKIKVQSEINMGTTFTISLPKKITPD